MPDQYFNSINTEKESENTQSDASNVNIDELVNRLVENGYQLDFVEIIKGAFSIFMQFARGFLSFALIFFAVNFILMSIPQISFLASVASSAFNPAFIIGLIFVVRSVQKGEFPEFNVYFSGFKFIKQLFLRSIVASVIFSVGSILILAYIKGDFNIIDINMVEFVQKIANNEIEVNYGAVLVLSLPLIYLSIAWQFSDYFIVFYGKNFWEAMELSRKVITKKWFSFLGFLFLLAIINIIGMLPMLLGLIITLPVTFISIYLAFEEIIIKQK